MDPVPAIHPSVRKPPRYSEPWKAPFHEQMHTRLREGMTVLDVGSGRAPAITRSQRPRDITYVGLDLSEDELRNAGLGVYDELVVADVTDPVPSLVGRVDLAVSWQVFEHVKPLDAALDNLFTYLKPGGTLVSLFSGGWSAFGVVNRLLPSKVGQRLVERSMGRSESNQPVFPAYYDRCSDRALREMTSAWGKVEILPLFRAANYFHFSRSLTRAYLSYENVIRRAGMNNLATHYLLVAQR